MSHRLITRDTPARFRACGNGQCPFADLLDTAARPGPVPAWAELTTREREVAALVVEGLSNREIGQRLFLSPHTVNYHLRHVYRKLAIRSRVDLVRCSSR